MNYMMLLALLSPFALVGCYGSVETITTAPNLESPQCKSGIASGLAAQKVEASGPIRVDRITVKDLTAFNLSLISVDDCGDSLGPIVAESWSLSPNFPGVFLESQNSEAQIYLNAGEPVEPAFVRAERSGLAVDIPVEIQWSVLQTPSLLRWYKADQFVQQNDGTVVGTNATNALRDHSKTLSYSAVVTGAGREPRLRPNLFAQPVLEFCGVSGGCSGISSNSHLRTGASFAQYAGTDFTLFYVVARASMGPQYFLVNQSNGNNSGIFLGYTNNTTLRLGLSGPQGNPQISANVSGYMAPAALEIITARLDTNAESPLKGLRLYRNGVQIAADPNVVSQQASVTTIPFIGTQRSDHNGARFYFGESATYTRALDATEICVIHRYLDQKYELGLNLTCP